MQLEITPEPTPEEREAIVRALAELDREPEPSPWWMSGAREGVVGDAED